MFSIGTLIQKLTAIHLRQGFEGSGLGLVICKKNATAHGVSISVSSVVGEGTKFIITGMFLKK